MTTRLFVVLVAAWGAWSAAPSAERALEAPRASQATVTPHAECSHLVMLKLPDVTVSEATTVAATTSGPVRVAHCRVSGVIGTEIRFQLLLPEEWNHKLMMGGGGGFVGTVDNQARTSVNAGYATVGTDTGHQGAVTDAGWALDHVERQLNFGYLAVHRTAAVAKTIVRSYYGANETRNYFSGCSNGGRQALMEAQRYPDDFDAIVAGAPAYDFVGLAAQFIKDAQAAFPDSKSLTPVFTPATMKSIETQILDRCDALDGVKDGVMEDPRRCTVDVSTLAGLTDAQRTALRTIYGATAAKGAVIYSAQPFGSEGEAAGWPAWITGGGPASPQGPSLRFAFGTQFFKYFVFGDPNWEYVRYDVANARHDARLVGTFLNATNPNLDAFKAKGRKLILWHGWSDPALTALASVAYYEQVKARDSAVDDYFRMFMMPGVLHCGGGPGPDTVDWASAIDAWAEGHQAPDRVVARKLANGATTRTRPLCRYPQHAVYRGTGSTDDEASFVCR